MACPVYASILFGVVFHRPPSQTPRRLRCAVIAPVDGEGVLCLLRDLGCQLMACVLRWSAARRLDDLMISTVSP